MQLSMVLSKGQKKIFMLLLRCLLYYADLSINIFIAVSFFVGFRSKDDRPVWFISTMLSLFVALLLRLQYSTYIIDVLRVGHMVRLMKKVLLRVPFRESSTRRIDLFAETYPQLIIHVFWLLVHAAWDWEDYDKPYTPVIIVSVPVGLAVTILSRTSFAEGVQNDSNQPWEWKRANKQVIQSSLEPEERMEEVVHDSIVGYKIGGSDYHVVENLSGLSADGFCQVKKCIKIMPSGHVRSYAVKVFCTSLLKKSKRAMLKHGKRATESDLDKVHAEIALMKKLSHPNLIKLMEVVDDPKEDKLYMILELAEHGQVMKWDHRSSSYYSPGSHTVLPEATATKFCLDITCALHYLHNNSIIHRDLKPENILLCANGECKIADFGVSELFPEKSSQKKLDTNGTAGTYHFMPPESLSGAEYDGIAADVYGLGVTLYTMLCGSLPFWITPKDLGKLEGNSDGSYAAQQLLFDKIQSGKFYLPATLSLDAQEIVHKMMRKDPKKRTSLADMLHHKWFSHYKVSLPQRLSLCERTEHVSAQDSELAISQLAVNAMHLQRNEKLHVVGDIILGTEVLKHAVDQHGAMPGGAGRSEIKFNTNENVAEGKPIAGKPMNAKAVAARRSFTTDEPTADSASKSASPAAILGHAASSSPAAESEAAMSNSVASDPPALAAALAPLSAQATGAQATNAPPADLGIPIAKIWV